MDEGTSHIRIRLLSHVASGDCLASASCSMLYSLSACTRLMFRVIQGCTSMLHLSVSPWRLLLAYYTVCLHGTLYPMMD